LYKQQSSGGGQYGALGFLWNIHPLALRKDQVLAIKLIKMVRLSQYIGGNVKLIGWPSTQNEALKTMIEYLECLFDNVVE
jgi:hypothetical protein